MKRLVASLLLLLLTTVGADPGWQNKVIGNVHIQVPTDCKIDVQNAPGRGGNLDGAAANMSAQLKAVSGEESLTPWKITTVSGRPARYIATKPDRTHEARQATLIDDTKAKNQLVIVDISYDSTSGSGKADSGHIMKSVEIR
jgi:hypothetical protein